MNTDNDLLDVSAKRVALTNILVRNQDVLRWYIDKMFEHLPPMYVKVMFKAFSMIDKEQRITQENMWALIPAFINSLPTEHFAVFLDHMSGFAECLHNEYHQYLTTEEPSTPGAEANQSVSIARSTHDDHGPDGQRQNDVSEHHPAQSDDGALSRSHPRY
jgi:hypothetical protein